MSNCGMSVLPSAYLVEKVTFITVQECNKKFYCEKTRILPKLKNSNCEKLRRKKSNLTKLKKSNSDKTQQLKFRQNSKAMKLKL